MEEIKLNINGVKAYRNLPAPILVEKAIKNGEGKLSETGALVVLTGKYTGRSPKDKFIVDTPTIHDEIAWGKVNVPTTRETFNSIWAKAEKYLEGKELYVLDAYAGADKKYTKKFRVINELASQNLFIRDLLIRPTDEELKTYGEPDYTILAAPGFKCVPEVDNTNSEAAIMIDYEAHKILIVGSQYAGEIKKSVFSTMNYCMVKENVLPMHCSANMDPETKETAVFFGLSGTGKTTLSADPNRMLIGDDEHGWSNDGVFNFEGGCYAKCINLEEEKEPEIYHAVKFGSLVENVVMNEKGEIDFDDNKYTENTRVGYPINYISNAVEPSKGGVPKVVIFLTADAFGVLPPISRLSTNAAKYHFVAGFTSKVAGTERGITEPVPTFSTLFGEPFMPMDPSVYADMFGKKIVDNNTQVYLVNTGWAGGSASSGVKRINLKWTRSMVTAALNGDLAKAEYGHSDIFNVDYPKHIENVPDEILDPITYWKSLGKSEAEYNENANKLAKMFEDNFNTKYPNISDEIKNAGPKAK